MIQRLVEGLIYCAAREFIASGGKRWWSGKTVLAAYDVVHDLHPLVLR